MRILFLTREPHPTYRVDVAVMFGKYLPRRGICSDIVARDAEACGEGSTVWPAGRAITCRASRSGAVNAARGLWHGLRVLMGVRPGQYDAIVVRDETMLAAVAIFVARRLGIPACYWMSFPMVEGFREAASLGWRQIGIARWLYNHAKAIFGAVLQYRFVLPQADHVFVQSDSMRRSLIDRGIPAERMSAVPMGVDLEMLADGDIAPMDDLRLQGRDVVIQVGSFDPARRLDVVIEAFALAKRRCPNLLLVMVGTAQLPSEEARLRRVADQAGVGQDVLWTGWLEMHATWRYVKAAQIGLSLIPRGPLYDVASPTKLVEYLALGVPAIVNDLPDQAYVAETSGGAMVVPLDAGAVADAIVHLLEMPRLRRAMGCAGQAFVAQQRSYEMLAAQVADVLARFSNGGAARGCRVQFVGGSPE